MANLLNKIPTNLTEYPNSFKRQGAFPLEAYSVFYANGGKTALENAQDYATNNPIAYVGQTLVTIKTVGGITEASLYIIKDTNGTLELLATSGEVTSVSTALTNLKKDFDDLTETTSKLESNVEGLIEDFDNLNEEVNGNLENGIQSIRDQHAEDIKNLNEEIQDINEYITSQTYFSVQLVKDVDLENNLITPLDKILEGGGTQVQDPVSAEQSIIYLKLDDTGDKDKYNEYMLVSQVDGTNKLLLTGTTDTDLSQYVKKDDVLILSELQSLINAADKSKQYSIGYDNEGELELQEISLDDGIWE